MYCRALLAGILIVVSYGCGGATTPGSPTQPSPPASIPPPQIPSLVGNWFGTASVRTDNPATGVPLTDGCEFRMFITSQSGGVFSGSMQSHGSGAATDPACERTGTFSGRVAPGGAVTDLQFTSVLGDVRRCTKVSGDGTFTGSATDTTITGSSADRWSCPGGGPAIGRFNCASPGDPFGGPTLECDRALSFTVSRRN